MANTEFRALLEPRGAQTAPDLARVLDGFSRRRAPADGARPGGSAHWRANFYGLDRVTRFTEADQERQQRVLAACGANLLWESYYIEQCGIAFCARMTMLARDVATRKLYGLIGADEAMHAHWLQSWLPSSAMRPADPFNRFIAQLVESGDAQPLYFVLQVVLEGFGMAHYRALAQGCCEPLLAVTLRTMMSDEALHHAGGLAAFDAAALDARQCAFVLDAVSTLLRGVRIGPTAILHALESEFDSLSQRQCVQICEQLQAQTSAGVKLLALRTLIEQPRMHWLVEALEGQRAFTPYSPEACAETYVAERG